MTTGKGLKLTFFFIFCIAVMSVLALLVLEGSFFIERMSVKKGAASREFIKNRGAALQRGAAPQIQEESPVKTPIDSANIKVISFTMTSQHPDFYFHSGSAIALKCIVQNTGEKEGSNFRSLIRTPRGEITSVNTKLLKNADRITLKGTFTPSESGILIVACRGDIDGEIEETNENDNREVAVLYVLP